MAKEEITLFEVRCDRCRALLRVEDSSGVLVRHRADSVGSMLFEMNGKPVLSYENVCAVCWARAERMVASMGPVDRTRGGKREIKKRKV